MAARISRDMGITREEFFRTLPDALGHTHYRIDGDRLEIDHCAARIRIRLGPESERRIAMLRLPVMHVEFQLDELPPAEQEAFMSRFERYFHRGGG